MDVDGVISLFGFDPHSPPPGSFAMVDGIAHYLSASAGDHLRRLAGAFELAWCTGWEEKANDYLPHLLELPGPLPVLSFDRAVGRANAHWKLAAIDAFAGPARPLAWVDDAHDTRCENWAAARAAPTLLVGTAAAEGLREAHVAHLLEWARTLEQDATPEPSRS